MLAGEGRVRWGLREASEGVCGSPPRVANGHPGSAVQIGGQGFSTGSAPHGFLEGRSLHRVGDQFGPGPEGYDRFGDAPSQHSVRENLGPILKLRLALMGGRFEMAWESLWRALLAK